MGHGWEGEKVRLVAMERQRHLDNAVAWLNDPVVTRWTVVGDMPVSKIAEHEFFDRMARSDGTDVGFAIETLDGDEHIGFTAIHRIDWRHGTGHCGTIIGRPDLWGQGYGTDALNTRTRYTFEVLGLRLVFSDALEGNQASLRMLAKAGWREYGRIPARYWKRGEFCTAVLYHADRGWWAPPGGP